MDHDLRVKMEYDKQKRRDRKEAVERWEMKQEFQREKMRMKMQKERELERKMKEEEEEIDNYKRQLREKGKFKKEVIMRSMEDLKAKNKSPLILREQETMKRMKMPNAMTTPNEFS